LNPSSYRVQKEIGNPYQLHRTIMRAFPDDLKPEERVLFRLYSDKRTALPVLMVQSHADPRWDFIHERGDYTLKDPQVKEFCYPPFSIGNSYWFRLFANPTKRTNNKRVGIYNEESQFKWLKRKGNLCGFNVIHAVITRKQEIKARTEKGAPTMTFQAVQFEGVLQVNDPDKFTKALKKGIGSAKAFGCGFLTIAKL